VQAVAREFVRGDIIPRVASLCPLGYQVSDDSAEVLLGSGDVLASMQECREFGAVVLIGDEREGLEHGLEPLASAASLVPKLGKLFEVDGDVTFVPGDQDRFDVGEVLVQSRTPDAGLLRDLSFASLGTGLVSSVGTKWGLFRHYWILVKLLLTIVATALLLVHTQTIRRVAHAAAEVTLSTSDLRRLRIQLAADAGAALLVLLVNTTLGVYKPRGLTRYGWRKGRASMDRR
jgi:hypothetical protein